MKKKILISTEFYPPAFRAGGPVKSVSNLVNILKKKYEIYIITSAKDLNQSTYMDIEKINVWIKKDGINIIYVGSKLNILINLITFFFTHNIHFTYVSSFFNPRFSLTTILLSLLFFKKVMIAPRGEFFHGALSIKNFKKKIYIFFFHILKYFIKIKWHATSRFEKNQIEKILKVKERKIIVCQNIIQLNNSISISNPIKIKNVLKIIISCRITPVKNIFNTILSLRDLVGEVEVHIFGAIDSEKYWIICKSEILKLPKNIKVKYRGSVDPKKLYNEYPNFNIFLMPSLSENFGYSIFEALSFGLPVIIGKNNPWNDMEKQKIGFNVNPECIKDISEKIQYFINLDEKNFDIIRKKCKKFTDNYYNILNNNSKKVLLNSFFE